MSTENKRKTVHIFILTVITFLLVGGIIAYICRGIPEDKVAEKESTTLPLEKSTEMDQIIEESGTDIQNQHMIATSEDNLPLFTNVDRQEITMESNPEPISYTIYHQGGINESEKFDSYISWHGCATCSASTILNAFTEDTVVPSMLVEEIEKDVFGEDIWSKNYEKSLAKQMPLSLYGVSRILDYYDVNHEYVRAFKDKAAVKQITKHLGMGKPVIIISSSINRSKKKSSGSTGYHTTILLGLTDTQKVVIGDPAGGSRITYSTVEELIPYMFPCKDVESTGCYFNGRERSGGYILVEPQGN